ncbi:MAG: hypothetical protein OXC93_03780, partial [Rhodospirillaceae bacterium]|nr:hypothetical protein [Rhodospirillaceae bacterium]
LHFAHPVDRGQSWLRQNNLHCLNLPPGASIVATLLFFVSVNLANGIKQGYPDIQSVFSRHQ